MPRFGAANEKQILLFGGTGLLNIHHMVTATDYILYRDNKSDTIMVSASAISPVSHLVLGVEQ